MRYLDGEPQLLPLRPAREIPFDDVPIGRVRGMSVTAPTDEHSLFVPYVYRGIGVDSLDYAAWLASEREREAERVRQEEIESARLRAQEQRRKAREERQRQREDRIIQSIPSLINAIYDTIKSEPERQAERERKAARARVRARRFGQRVAAPTPGWKPPTGEDIDAWLAEYDETSAADASVTTGGVTTT